MEGMDDSFLPSPVNSTPNPTPEQQMGLMGRWADWMSNDSNRAALLQFGLSMMQPVGLGQTPLGHTAQAIGQSGEAMGRIRTENMKQQDLDSKEELRSAQAGAQEARANTAATRASAASERLGLQREGLDLRRNNMRLTALVRLQKQHADEMLIAPEKDRVPFRQWLARNPALLQQLGGDDDAFDVLPGGGGGAGAPAADKEPPMPGARLAPDGQWYIPDPKRPGKFLRVE